MSKDKSLQLKGVAILMMLWYHLFLEEPSGIYHQIALACNPIAFFLIISGYGYSFKLLHGSLNIANVLRKNFKLYAFYWVTLLIFITMGHFMGKAGYPGSVTDIVSNVVGYKCTYNRETWFLLPYALITLLSVLFLPYLFHLKPKKLIVVAILYFVGYVAFHFLYIDLDSDDSFVILKQQIFFVYLFFFYFSLGVLFYKYFKKSDKPCSYNNAFLIVILLLLIVARSFYTGSSLIVNGVYAFIFIIIFNLVKIGSVVGKVLSKLGKYSLAMWLTHTYYSHYLFSQYISWSQYHVVKFLTLVVVSFLTAYLLQNAWNMVINRMK